MTGRTDRPDPAGGSALTDALALRLELEDFYYREADLLDDRRFDEWLDLLCEDIAYRVPMTRNVHSSHGQREYLTDPLDVSWMDEGKLTLRQRVEQLQTGIHWAEEPVSRTTHLCTNLRVLGSGSDENGRWAEARINFLVYRNRLRSEEDFLVGKRVDRLHEADGGWRVHRRTVYLDQTVLLANNLTTFL